MKIMAVCHNKSDLKLLVNYIQSVKPNTEIIATDDCQVALESANNIDFIFTEVRLKNSTGFSLRKLVKERNPNVNVVFIDDSDQYAVSAMQVHAFDYIIKPITMEKIKNSFSRT